MKKLKTPLLVENQDLPKEMTQRQFEEMMANNNYKFIPDFTFNVKGLFVIGATGTSDKGDYLYAFIYGEGAEYYDCAIVKTEDFYFKTYKQWKKAIKDMAKQLTTRWKKWVVDLYYNTK